jgi:hypothetical protein
MIKHWRFAVAALNCVSGGWNDRSRSARADTYHAEHHRRSNQKLAKAFEATTDIKVNTTIGAPVASASIQADKSFQTGA